MHDYIFSFAQRFLLLDERMPSGSGGESAALVRELTSRNNTISADGGSGGGSLETVIAAVSDATRADQMARVAGKNGTTFSLAAGGPWTRRPDAEGNRLVRSFVRSMAHIYF